MVDLAHLCIERGHNEDIIDRHRPFITVEIGPRPSDELTNEPHDLGCLFRRRTAVAAVVDFEKDKSRTLRPRLAVDSLLIKPFDTSETVVIEDFGCVSAEVRVHAVGPVEEDPRGIWHRVVIAQNVPKGRHASPGRMRGLTRLGQLLRVA